MEVDRAASPIDNDRWQDERTRHAADRASEGRGRATAAAADRAIDEGVMSAAADVHRVGGIVCVVVIVFLRTSNAMCAIVVHNNQIDMEEEEEGNTTIK